MLATETPITRRVSAWFGGSRGSCAGTVSVAWIPPDALPGTVTWAGPPGTGCGSGAEAAGPEPAAAPDAGPRTAAPAGPAATATPVQTAPDQARKHTPANALRPRIRPHRSAPARSPRASHNEDAGCGPGLRPVTKP